MVKLNHDFFFGASGKNGFVSYFDNAYKLGEGWRVFIIKGGPGTGKSTLMKKVAAKAAEKGLKYENGYCSSDINSLDVVVIPEIKTAIMDGTAPHVVEPIYPGACEQLVDLSSCWNSDKLRSNAAEIIMLSDKCGEHHKDADRYLSAAASFRSSYHNILLEYADVDKIKTGAKNLCSSLHVKSGTSSCTRRFISAVSCDGVYSFADENKMNYGKVITIEDKYTVLGSLMLKEIDTILSKSECNYILCPCSQDTDITEHILIPSHNTMITVSNKYHAAENDRVIHASRYMKKALSVQDKKVLTENEKLESTFIKKAAESIKQAKAVHDDLEAIYTSAMDFKKIERKTKEVLQSIFN